MSKKTKLRNRLLSKPKDFTWKETKSLLGKMGYKELQGDGSRVKFFRESPRRIISIHKSHPGEILKDYQVNQLIKILKQETLK